LYELIATDTVARRGLFINMGYWRNVQSIDQACEAMVQLLAEKVQLGPQDVALDVGFGFGEQDLYWMTRFAPRRMVGINIVTRTSSLCCAVSAFARSSGRPEYVSSTT